MAKYRYTDKQETNEHGQTLGFAVWMGGPSLTYVAGIICEDGSRANWFKTGEPDTWFSIPGYIHRKSQKIKGFITSDDGLYHFTANKYGIPMYYDSEDTFTTSLGIDYLNTGDSYALTIVRSADTGNYRVASWGDLVEKWSGESYPASLGNTPEWCQSYGQIARVKYNQYGAMIAAIVTTWLGGKLASFQSYA